ncbi:hypothetical protein C8A05DRAFT_20496, partial [Staphylotrichum tortipilum]
VSGTGLLLSQPTGTSDDPEPHPLATGDFAFVPAWTEHRFVNGSDVEDLHLVVIRSGPSPVGGRMRTGYGVNGCKSKCCGGRWLTRGAHGIGLVNHRVAAGDLGLPRSRTIPTVSLPVGLLLGVVRRQDVG